MTETAISPDARDAAIDPIRAGTARAPLSLGDRMYRDMSNAPARWQSAGRAPRSRSERDARGTPVASIAAQMRSGTLRVARSEREATAAKASIRTALAIPRKSYGSMPVASTERPHNGMPARQHLRTIHASARTTFYG